MTNEFQNSGTILIIQLTRTGDLIQTYQAASKIKQANPKIKLSLLAREQFVAELNFLLKDIFDSIITFPDLGKDKIEPSDLENTYNNYLAPQIGPETNVCVNISFCEMSQHIAKKVPAKHKIGPYKNNEGMVCIDDPWGQFAYANVLESKLCPFNLVDIFKLMLGTNQVPINNENDLKDRKKIILIHPFASLTKKKWGISKWSETLYNLLRQYPEHRVAIVGTKNEQKESERLINGPLLEDYINRIDNFTGKLSIEETYERLKDCKLFIGNDSMVSHLAAVANTPSLIISLGPVKQRETAPYQLNSLTLSPRISCYPCQVETPCDLLPCHGKINHQLVSHIASHIIDTGTIENLSLNGLNEHIYSSTNFYCNYLVNNRLSLRKVDNHPYSVDQYFAELYEVIWSFMLNDEEVNINFPEVTEGTVEAIKYNLEGIEKTHHLYQHAIKFSAQLSRELEKKTPDISISKKLSEKIIEVDELSQILANNYPLIAPIINYYYTHKSNINADKMYDIANANFLAYNQASNALSILVELISKTLENFQVTKQKQVNTPDKLANS